MSLIQSGKIFNDGEQLTAGKLNQMFSDATLSTTGVDGTSIIVNENDVLAVRSINSSRIDSGAVITDKLPNSTVTAVNGTPDGVTLPKLQHIETDKILGRTTTGDGVVEAVTLNTDNAMANASATSLATDGSIKAYVDSMRPRYVPLTGGTVDLLQKRESTGTSIITYNIADFTSGDSLFATNRIVGLVIAAFAQSSQEQNRALAEMPDGANLTLVRAAAYSTADYDQSETLTTVPINGDQTSFDITLNVNSLAGGTEAQAHIRGAIIQPGL